MWPARPRTTTSSGGIRGAGANLGIVTSFEYRLHRVGPVLDGFVVYPLAEGKAALRGFDEFSATCPDEVSTAGFVATAPNGEPAVVVGACFCGSLAEGEKVLKPLRAIATPLADFIAPQPYAQVQTLFDEAWPPARRYYNKSSIGRRLSEAAIEALIGMGRTLPTPQTAIALQRLHGAAGRVGASDTAFPHRYDQILKGAKPADLPIEQPTTFELVINLEHRQGTWPHDPIGVADMSGSLSNNALSHGAFHLAAGLRSLAWPQANAGVIRTARDRLRRSRLSRGAT